MTQTQPSGRTTGGKPVNLTQLQTEVQEDGIDCSAGLGMAADYIFTYDAQGTMVDFAAADQPVVDQCIADHVAMRNKTDAELSAEFQATSDPARKQDLRDQMSGLLPREQVPITQEEWDQRK